MAQCIIAALFNEDEDGERRKCKRKLILLAASNF